MAVRLVATDLDGTLLGTDGHVSARNRAALAAVEDAGIIVVFVTGRPPRWLGQVAEEAGARGLAICANGALVYDLEQDAVVLENSLLPEAAARLVAALRDRAPGVVFAVERGTRFGHEPAYVPMWPTGDRDIARVEELVSRPVAKLLAKHPDLDAVALHELATELAGGDAMVTYSGDTLVEIGGAGVSKAVALEALCDERGITAAEVIAFGDMPNDVPLLTWAGRGVAVANAHPSVLAVADEVTLSNDEDGVAVVLESLLSS
jgi:Cof subfamily protein (haloacid dehalogenase superfamily)